jgi:hypothetical protein
MVLMFTQFFVDRMESRLLSAVDARAADELGGRFEQIGAVDDPQVAAVRRIADAVIRSTEGLVERQAEVWQRSIDAAQRRWSELASAAGNQLETALAGALSQSIASHAERLAASAEASAEQNRRNWSRLQQAIADGAEKAKSQQAELTRQGEILLRVVEATGHVTRLQEALNGNLAALSGAQHFEETVLNLAGAIHLLNARLGQVAAPQIDLKEPSSVGRAA